MAGMPGDDIRQRVLFMRHPETVSNTQHFFSGRLDVPLTPHGEQQRTRAVEALVAFAPERVFCSPLSRARGLAEEAAARLGVPCEPLDDLIEIDFGPLEGVTVADAMGSGATFPWPIDDEGVSHPPAGAESFEHVRERCRRVLDGLRPLTGRTACVTHGGFLRMLLAAVYDIPLTRFWDQHVLNVSSHYLTCDGRTFALGGFNLSPEEVVAHATTPNDYDTRDIWGAGGASAARRGESA